MTEKHLLTALEGRKPGRPPIWMMRQAGRYLPEYREIRNRAAGFLELCYTPEMAAEISLQPVRRFGMDGCILFSDILVIPDALGQQVRFEENVGPLLTPCIMDGQGLALLRPERVMERLAPVCETVRLCRKSLPPHVTMIGFAGAPWTVATYMVGGRGSTDQAAARKWAYRNPGEFSQLIEILVEATAEYLIAQIDAGAEAIQVFDTWAGALPAVELRKWCINPVKKLIGRVHEKHPRIPVIGFPKSAGFSYRDFVLETGVQGVSVDHGMPLDYARQFLQPLAAVQGNLDPLLVVTGGNSMLEAAGQILKSLGQGPFIFNLGHGIVPETPVENVGELVRFVQQWQG
ncbi:MAG TPA: uroporphyrinogen decarboxylase [Alphaproteobacteria bacterium]|nr:uroporphyrinogen decarboxylase [Alphaproteobacteria bacterium]